MRHSQTTRLALMEIDLAAIVASSVLATVPFIYLHRDAAWSRWPEYAKIIVLSLPGWILAFSHARLYTSRFLARGIDEARRLAMGVAYGAVALALASVVVKVRVERSWYVVVAVAVFIAVGAERTVVRAVFAHRRRIGRMCRRVVIVGTNHEADAIAELFRAQPTLGYLVVGRVRGPELDLQEDTARADMRVIDRTLHLVQAEAASGVVIASSAMNVSTSTWLIRELTERGVHVELSSTLLDISSSRITVRPLGRLPVFYIEPVLRDGWRAHAKRTFDFVLSVSLILLTAPIVLVTAILVRSTSTGPAFFRQTRIGRDGRPFTIYKLRTMVQDAESMLPTLHAHNELDGPLFKMKEDPRITKVGRVLRQTSIDELPQLWNVLRGDMAMVGPRPALPSEAAQWPPHAFQRLRVRPGLTGMWQVAGRNLMRFEEYLRLDMYYVDNWSLFTDLAIVAKTIPTVIARRGAS
jgi:exopolysaccharide biosynthesis polyprenyl glycosylphosphotransferase